MKLRIRVHTGMLAILLIVSATLPASAKEILFFTEVKEFTIKTGAVGKTVSLGFAIAPVVASAYAVTRTEASFPSILGLAIDVLEYAPTAYALGSIAQKYNALPAQKKFLESLIKAPDDLRVYQLASGNTEYLLKAMPYRKDMRTITWIESEAEISPEVLADFEKDWGKSVRVTDPENFL
ncbi:MAG: hypothetical protein EOP09_08075, partial [Proteobacteria bacterium]